MIGLPLRASDVEVFEQVIVPRYLSFFGALALNALIPHKPSSVANIGCRWGFPDHEIVERLEEGSIVGFDPSSEMVEVAKKLAAEQPSSKMTRTYQVEQGLPSKVAGDQFTHAICVHPICGALERLKLLQELQRILVPGGQAVLAVPLRGSFAEILDMVREYALRNDLAELATNIELAVASRPTIETVSEEMETAGLTEIDVDVQLLSVTFGTGREFLDDPIAKLIVEPEIRASLSADEVTMAGAIDYIRDAVSKYWSDGVFELTVNVGCVSGRRAA